MRDETRPVERPPTPGLADVTQLIDSVRAAGTPVELRTSGSDKALSMAVQLTIFRIVQETLTNVMRHAPGATASVSIDVSRDEVRIEVTDTGDERHQATLSDTETMGHGIVGMRERLPGPSADRSRLVRCRAEDSGCQRAFPSIGHRDYPGARRR